jgi:hypothetical protein
MSAVGKNEQGSYAGDDGKACHLADGDLALQEAVDTAHWEL